MKIEEAVKNVIVDYYNQDEEAYFAFTPITTDDVRIVWMCKTLQNWKAIAITFMPDLAMYEVTYNGDKNEAYVDEYKKINNQVVRMDQYES